MCSEALLSTRPALKRHGARAGTELLKQNAQGKRLLVLLTDSATGKAEPVCEIKRIYMI
jgi:hypothetical protein